MDITAGIGFPDRPITEAEVAEVIEKALEQGNWTNKKVLMILPDSTRTAPVGLIYKTIFDLLCDKAAKLDAIIALGTHQPMSEDSIFKRVDITRQEYQTKYSRKTRFFNHTWDDPKTLINIGTITAASVRQITGAMMDEDIEISINRLIFNYDCLMVIGPVFPHESVGYSGGNKYFFPGICGEGILDKFHWLGATITNAVINGTKDTPVRKLIDAAAEFIDIPRLYFNIVVSRGTLHGLYIGDGIGSWGKAAELSSVVNVFYTGRRYKTVVGIAPEKYDELWTAGKVAYKAETIVEDGGDMIIYAPHIKEFSFTHGKYIDKVGYHVRDYYLTRMDMFKDVPSTILAHCVNVKGAGTFSCGVEKPRINVILASAIPEERCLELNLGYINPADIDISAYQGRENEGILCIPNAGEVLYQTEKRTY